VKIVATTDSTVLIQRETGTGKELIASAIHNLRSRGKNNFVRFNCAAIPAGLLESELFGHERCAFTGALTRKLGRFELADKGTLFLDEIGDMPLEIQAKLLRVLQEQEFERLGATQTQRVNVRVIAATNCDLKQMMADKQFRSDLYFRLNVFPITIPPLRDRREDIADLVKAFVTRFSIRLNRRIEMVPIATLEALIHYDWPGNIRELQSFLERSVILSAGPTLQAPLESLASNAFGVVNPAGGSTLEEGETRHVPGANISEGVRDFFWAQGMQSSVAASYDCIKAFFETDFTDDLKKIGVPTLVLHGDPDQNVPHADAGLLSSKIIRNATLKVIPGAPHGMCTTLADQINADLLAFLKA